MDVDDLDYIDYLGYRRDAFISRYNQTPAGVEYLDNAWRLEQTEPDRPALREQFGGRAQSEVTTQNGGSH